MKYILFWLLSLAPAADAVMAQAPITNVAMAPSSIHDGLDSILQNNVSATGIVNYKGILKNKAALDAYLQVLSDNVPQGTEPREEQMAYWINAYNAFTIDLIARNYPTTSITKFDDGKTWDVKRIKIGNKKYSLNQIENEILRAKYKDPRIHFALNCAAKSCPPLYNHAFTADRLEEVLTERTKAFVNDPSFNTFSSKSLKISKIFDWYAVDFGNIHSFLNQYSTKKLSTKTPVEYGEYNWNLNDK